MIEIKITVEAALTLLLQRMKFELKFRQKAGLLNKNLRIEDLSFEEQIEIVEASIFDTVFLLPVDIIIQENNLINIITETVKALSHILKKEQFLTFSQKKARKLIQPIFNYFTDTNCLKDFQSN